MIPRLSSSVIGARQPETSCGSDAEFDRSDGKLVRDLLFGDVNASLAATTGVESGMEVVKFLLAGADVVLTASSLLRHGPAHTEALVTQLSTWMESRGYTSVQQMKGSMSQQKVRDPSVFARANYMRVLNSYQNPFVP